jgi:hypothetical protein
MLRRDDLLELRRRLAVPPAARLVQVAAPILPGEVPALPDFLVRKRTPEIDERIRRLVEEDQKRPLVGGIKALFAAIEENERRGGYYI